MNDFKIFVKGTYKKRAQKYDFYSMLYNIMGFNLNGYRKKAIPKLNLSEGDFVIDIGCGTGLNFPHILEKIGRSGKLIGIDLTKEMLDKAKEKCDSNGWNNVELIHSDIAEFEFPKEVDAVFSSYAFSLSQDLESITQKVCNALKEDGKFGILDLSLPSNWKAKLRPLFYPTVRPFAVTNEVIDSKPWVKIRNSINKYFDNVEYKELYSGFAYIITGTK